MGPLGPQGPAGQDAEGAVPLACDTLAAQEPTPNSSTAVDAYVQITGIPGDSTADKFHKWIDASSFCFGGSSAADDGTFTVEKVPDSATVPLLQALSDGTEIATARVELFRQNDKFGEVASIRFSGVTVRGYRLGGHDALTEDLSFRWTTATMTRGGVTTNLEAPDAVEHETMPRCDALTTSEDPSVMPSVSSYLQIDGIPGESTADKFHKWIDVSTFCFGVTAAGDSSLIPVTLAKGLDRASPPLAASFRTGTGLPGARLDVVRNGGGDVPRFRLELTAPTVSGIRSGARGGLLHEDLALTSTSITVTHFSIDSKGLPAGFQEVTLTS